MSFSQTNLPLLDILNMSPRIILLLFLSPVLGAVLGDPPASSAAGPVPTHVVNLSRLPAHAGDVTKNNGNDFRNAMMKSLLSVCPDPPAGKNGTCSTTTVQSGEINTISDNSLQTGKLQYIFDYANYESTAARDQMLAYAVAAFQGAAAKACNITKYSFPSTASGSCPTINRKRVVGGSGAGRADCIGELNLCNGPNSISKSRILYPLSAYTYHSPADL
jgi:hypothetical protein